MNILICPNSFKECADSSTISEMIREKFITDSKHNLEIKPLTDGGDGFLKSCQIIYDIEGFNSLFIRNYVDGLNQFNLLYLKKDKRVFIESADIIGLKVIPDSKRNPMKLNSKDIGFILKELSSLVKSQKIQIESVWIGIGGTATIDFGIGACSQLGLKLFDNKSKQLEPVPQNFIKTQRLEFEFPKLPFRIICIVDVDTELIGDPGAIEMFGPQKGAAIDDIKNIKNGIKNILNLIQSDLNLSVPKNLNGAGGGLAAGLNIFLNAEIISAKHFIRTEILKGIDFRKIDTVISGEGKFDIQSLEGKATGVIVELCKQYSIPLFLINGSTELPDKIKLPDNVFCINLTEFYHSKNEAIINFEEGIKRATEIVIKQLSK